MFSRLRAHAIGACALGLVGACLPLCAAADTPAPQATPLPEIGHVVTSDRQDEPLDATARVTYVVTKADMLRNGWLNAGDAIETVPGVELVRYGAAGAQISAEIRGASSNQVLVLLDGRPVPGAQLGGVDLAQYATLGIDRIEVVEGPGATLYGSGAVGGVINIITTSPRRAGTVNSSLEAGSFGERDVRVESPALSVESLTATNDYVFQTPDGTTASRTNADVRDLHGRVAFATNAGPFDVAFSGGISERHLGVPGSLDFPTVGERQNDGLADALATFTLARPHARTTLDLSAMRDRINALDADPADAATAGAFNATSVESRVQLDLRNAVSAGGQRLIYGVDLSREAVRNDDGFGDVAADALAQSALYVQESLAVGSRSRVYAGLRGENDAGYGSSLTPSVGAVVGLARGVALRVNAATAFRAPTAAELYFPNFGNPALLPERTAGGDVTLDLDRFLGGASLGWFVQNGHDLIAYDATANTDVNVARSSVAGFVLTVATRPLNGVSARVNLTDTYRALDLTGDAVRLPYRPVFVTNLELRYAPRVPSALDAFGFIAHTEGLRDPAGALPFTRIDAYVRLRLAPRALLSIRGTNLLDEAYQTVAGYPATGRGFAIGIATR